MYVYFSLLELKFFFKGKVLLFNPPQDLEKCSMVSQYS